MKVKNLRQVWRKLLSPVMIAEGASDEKSFVEFHVRIRDTVHETVVGV